MTFTRLQIGWAWGAGRGRVVGKKPGQVSRSQAQRGPEGKAEGLGHHYIFALWAGEKGDQGRSLINASPQARLQKG